MDVCVCTDIEIQSAESYFCCLWVYGNQSNLDAGLVTQPFFQSFILCQMSANLAVIENYCLKSFLLKPLHIHLSIFISYVFIPLYLSHHQSQLLLMHYIVLHTKI